MKSTLLIALLAAGCAFAQTDDTALSAPADAWALPARVETDAVPNASDAADDPAIWVHPVDPAQSLVIGTDKEGGLALYDLEGRQLQYVEGLKPNNVDVRGGFQWNGRTVDLVATADRASDTIALFAVNAETRRLEPVSVGRLSVPFAVYGSGMYRSPKTEIMYVYVNSKDGDLAQYAITAEGADVTAREVRRMKFDSQLEGVASDETGGALFIGEEARGVWRLGAEPDSKEEPRLLARTHAAGGELEPDVEGITLYRNAAGRLRMLVSSQGNSCFCVYELRRRGRAAYLGRFAVRAANGIDEVTGTDGIDAAATALGPAFPRGLIVVQDDANDTGRQNFKYASLADLEALIGAR